MKKRSFLILSLILTLLILFSYNLYTPAPAFSPQSRQYDEAYFITKFGNHNIQLFEKNNFVISNEELNGFIAYGMEEKGWFQSPNSAFEPSYCQVQLMENQLLFQLYGKLYFASVKFELLLVPHYEDQKLYLTIEEARLSRFKLSNSLVNLFFDDSLPIEDNQLVIALNLPDIVTIDEISFEDQQIILWYHLNRDQVLNQLLQEIKQYFTK